MSKCHFESTSWRGIRSVWNDLLKGSRWRVGDGKDVCFLTDKWTFSWFTLLEVAIAKVPLNILYSLVADF